MTSEKGERATYGKPGALRRCANGWRTTPEAGAIAPSRIPREARPDSQGPAVVARLGRVGAKGDHRNGQKERDADDDDRKPEPSGSYLSSHHPAPSERWSTS